MDFPAFQIVPHVLSVLEGETEKTLSLLSLLHPNRCLYTLIRTSLSLLFLKVNANSSRLCSSAACLRHRSRPLLNPLQFVPAGFFWTAQLRTGPISPVVVSPLLNRGERSCPLTAGHASPKANAGGCCPSFLQGHIAGSGSVWQDSWVLLCFILAGQLKCVLVHGVILFQIWDSAFPFVEHDEVPVSPFLQLVEAFLNGSTTIWCVSHSSQFFELAEGAHYPSQGRAPAIPVAIKHTGQVCVLAPLTCPA